jgi:hypothetical protein
MRRAVAARPDDSATRQHLSHVLERLGDISGALTVLEPLPPLLGPWPEVLQRVEMRIADLRKRR